MAETKKVTTMELEVVDLQCSKCYKKVKKLLCKIPEIQDQVYDEKNNKVTIKVVCCNPEKMRDKIRCKGKELITCIKILPPPPPKKPEPEKQESKPESNQKPAPKKQESKPESNQKPAPKPEPAPCYPPVWLGPVSVKICCTDCRKGRGGVPCYNPCYGSGYNCHLPVRDCCTDCREGRRGGPCYNPCYGGGYGGYSGSRCSEYFSEENPQGCTIM